MNDGQIDSDSTWNFPVQIRRRSPEFPAMKKGNPDNPETIYVCIDREKHPVAFNNRFDSFIDAGYAPMEAIREVSRPIEMNLYYDELGAYLVESEACEATEIFNPYTGILMEECEEDMP